jgi:hypothetical protein
MGTRIVPRDCTICVVLFRNPSEWHGSLMEGGAKYAPRETADGEELKQAYHGVWLTRAGALLAAEWEKLDVADRAEIEGQILTRVAKLKRHERSQSKGSTDDARE